MKYSSIQSESDIKLLKAQKDAKNDVINLSKKIPRHTFIGYFLNTIIEKL
jgi:hypothetical protein